MVDARRKQLKGGVGVAKAKLDLGVFSAQIHIAGASLQCCLEKFISIQPPSLADQIPDDLKGGRRLVQGFWALIWRHDRDQRFVQLASN